MAAFGPDPEMVGNDTSLRRPVSRRKVSSASTASISVSRPDGATRSNQARKVVTAAPSRRWAVRLPAISVSFLMAFMAATGSVRRRAAMPGDRLGDGVSRGRLVDPHGAVLGAEGGEVFHQGRRQSYLGEAGE